MNLKQKKKFLKSIFFLISIYFPPNLALKNQIKYPIIWNDGTTNHVCILLFVPYTTNHVCILCSYLVPRFRSLHIYSMISLYNDDLDLFIYIFNDSNILILLVVVWNRKIIC